MAPLIITDVGLLSWSDAYALQQRIVAARKAGAIDDMMNMIHAHPTVWEAMGDAFASVRGLQINV